MLYSYSGFIPRNLELALSELDFTNCLKEFPLDLTFNQFLVYKGYIGVINTEDTETEINKLENLNIKKNERLYDIENIDLDDTTLVNYEEIDSKKYSKILKICLKIRDFTFSSCSRIRNPKVILENLY